MRSIRPIVMWAAMLAGAPSIAGDALDVRGFLYIVSLNDGPMVVAIDSAAEGSARVDGTLDHIYLYTGQRSAIDLDTQHKVGLTPNFSNVDGRLIYREGVLVVTTSHISMQFGGGEATDLPAPVGTGSSQPRMRVWFSGSGGVVPVVTASPIRGDALQQARIIGDCVTSPGACLEIGNQVLQVVP